MASLTFYPKFQAFDDNGDPLNLGKVYTYESGASTTPLATYTDAGAGTANANPVILNSRGEANIWLSGSKLYRFVLATSTDTTIWTVDGIGGGATVVASRDGTYTRLTSVSGTDTITATGPADMSAYATGQTFSFVVANTNTGAATINISSIGAKAITKSGSVALAAGDLPANAVVMISYDGTRFQLIAVPASASTSLSLAGGTMTGPITFAATTPAKDLLNGIVEGRLTLTTSTPVTTTDVTGSTTVYFTPYKGNRVAVYDNTNWLLRTFTEISVAVPSTTATPFDVFIYDNSGTLTLEAVNWTNSTTRATALTTQNGVYVKTGGVTKRYLGTGCTTGVSGQCADSIANRLLYNYYNRLPRQGLTQFTVSRTSSASSWSEVNSEIRFSYMVGVKEDASAVSFSGSVANSAGARAYTAFGIDSTTSAQTPQSRTLCASAGEGYLAALNMSTIFAAGLHYVTLLNYTSSGTNTWESINTSAAVGNCAITCVVTG